DVHHAELEEFVDQRRRDFRPLVHLAAERPDLAIGELIHAVTKQTLVLGKARQGGLRHARDVSIRFMRRALRSMFWTALAAAAFAGPAGHAQQPTQAEQAQPAQPPQPVFRTGINYVRVDVIVSDRNGGGVADLKQSDFEVTEDGKP